jgi:hypothetical protein
MCELVHGFAPSDNHEAAHSCGNGHLGCVNPNHLRWDTPSGNAADKYEHGTLLYGEKHPRVKLTLAQAEEIHRRAWEGESGQVLSAEFGVSEGNVSMIKYGTSWKIDIGGVDGPSTDEDRYVHCDNGRRKHLTEEQVITVKRMIARGIPMKIVSDKTGIRYDRITAINRGEFYSHIVPPEHDKDAA